MNGVTVACRENISVCGLAITASWECGVGAISKQGIDHESVAISLCRREFNCEHAIRRKADDHCHVVSAAGWCVECRAVGSLVNVEIEPETVSFQPREILK